MKGKNKLVPRLLGINKESVVRVDEKTKEIMKTWPLTTVRRWAASPNSFTLVRVMSLFKCFYSCLVTKYVIMDHIKELLVDDFSEIK